MDEVVVPLDGSRMAVRAVPIGRAVAEGAGVPLRLVRVVDGDGAEEVDGPPEAVDGGSPCGRATVEVVPAPAPRDVAGGILDAVAETPGRSLLCMSTHGRSGVGSALFGSTAEQVLERTADPVLLVGRHCTYPWPQDRRALVVPVDGGPVAEGLVPLVASVVHAHQLEAVLVEVSHPFDGEVASEPTRGLAAVAAALAEAGVEAKQIHRFGSDVALAIASAAREHGAALIAMATRSTPGPRRVLLGSVTARTVHAADCPVLVLPPGAADEGSGSRTGRRG